MLIRKDICSSARSGVKFRLSAILQKESKYHQVEPQIADVGEPLP